MEFSTAALIFTKLPQTWHPRREQPSWDRVFTGRMDIVANAQGKTDKMKQYVMEAAMFSEIIKHGMTESERLGMAENACKEVDKNARKNGK